MASGCLAEGAYSGLRALNRVCGQELHQQLTSTRFPGLEGSRDVVARGVAGDQENS